MEALPLPQDPVMAGGGDLNIEDFPSADLLASLLNPGPFVPCTSDESGIHPTLRNHSQTSSTRITGFPAKGD